MDTPAKPLNIAILGASGGVGGRIARLALDRGHRLRLQTREASRLDGLRGRAEIVEGDPAAADTLDRLLAGSDTVIFALGVSGRGDTTLFSETTRALIAAMRRADVRRLIAITGVGAGATRGHGGWFYDRVIFPAFTRNRYADKDRQEALIAASGTDWTIVRPAPFSDKSPDGPLQVHQTVPETLVLRRVTRDEVARFVVEAAETGNHLHECPFIGHP